MAIVTKNKVNDEMKTKLVNLLKNIFQFEDKDLDFGIHRIMNQKREDIRNFIEKELIAKIVEQLELVGEEKKKEIIGELEELKNKVIEAYGKDAFRNSELKNEFKKYELGRKYTEKLKQLESIKISKDLEREIYNHIYSFFSRYYDKGDFLSQRRYTHQGNERYAIPYDGEEVLLHWANKDQYYIKSTLNFQKYTFKSNGLNVIFRIVDAEEEKGNIKSDENRYFVVHAKKPYEFEGNTLNIYFEYRPLTNPERNKRKFGKKTQINQNDINKYNYGFLKKKLDKEQKAKDMFETENGKTTLEKNLYKYTTSNKADYFIHKDLEGFLRRELSFYLRNEVLKLEDFESNDMQKKLLKAKVIRNIADKIINFLSQIENFQRKIWEKKKIVITTDYVITLDRIIEYGGKSFYNEIVEKIIENKEQIKEWKNLFSIKVKDNKSLLAKLKDKNDKYLKLPIDTKYFDEEFKFRLLESVTKDKSLDAIVDGISIKSDNFQAIRILSSLCKNKIDCVYLDPPYNSKSTEILYKNDFKHSSWLSLMENRLEETKSLVNKNGALIIAIDENEQERLGLLLENKFFGYDRTCVAIVHNPRGIQGINFSYCHDYAYFIFPRGTDTIGMRTIPKSEWEYSNLRKWGGESTRETGANVFYPIYVKNGKITKIGDVPPDNFHPSKRVIDKGNGVFEVWPIDQTSVERKWRYTKESLLEKIDAIAVKQSEDEIEIQIAQTHGKFKTNWVDPIYDAGTYGTRLLTKMGLESKNIFPKSLYTVRDCLEAVVGNNANAKVLDFFAGSGTTAHAIMELNRGDKGNRKFILVEMADYFDTVMMPRIKKVAYSFDWKDGKPTETNGLGILCKYHYLEQYEDALENIEFDQKTIEEFSDYFIKYMLDFETKTSNTFLNIEKIEDPFNYKLKVLETVGKPAKIATVDLIETFNYLIGLEVEKIGIKEANRRKYVFITGIAANGEKTLVVWRPLNKIDFEKDKEIIEKIRDKFETDEIYINGDAAVKGFKQIESKFKAFLWD